MSDYDDDDDDDDDHDHDHDHDDDDDDDEENDPVASGSAEVASSSTDKRHGGLQGGG